MESIANERLYLGPLPGHNGTTTEVVIGPYFVPTGRLKKSRNAAGSSSPDVRKQTKAGSSGSGRWSSTLIFVRFGTQLGSATPFKLNMYTFFLKDNSWFLTMISFRFQSTTAFIIPAGGVVFTF